MCHTAVQEDVPLEISATSGVRLERVADAVPEEQVWLKTRQQGTTLLPQGFFARVGCGDDDDDGCDDDYCYYHIQNIINQHYFVE